MLNRLLFLLTVSVAVGLVGLVVLAPGLVEENSPAPSWLVLFASDAIIRRGTIGCAVGLVVTAALFFGGPPRDQGHYARRKRPRSANTIGA
jgi:hypothetical protein